MFTLLENFTTRTIDDEAHKNEKKKEMNKRTDQGKHNHWKTLVLSCSLSSKRETYFSLILIRLIHIVRDRQLDSTDVSPHQKNSCVDEGGGNPRVTGQISV